MSFQQCLFIDSLSSALEACLKMKVECPICGIEGFIEKRGNSYRIKHYAGYNGNQRKYLIHTVPQDIMDNMGINGNQNMGIKTWESMTLI